MMRCGYCVGVPPGEAVPSGMFGRVGSDPGGCLCCGQVATWLYDDPCTANHPGYGTQATLNTESEAEEGP